MARSARVAWIVGLLAAITAGTGCDGKTIQLGNCGHTQVPASQVVWIGDSWVTIPGNQVTQVEQSAQAAGAIGPGDTYTVDAKNGTLMAQIAAEYTAQQMTTTPAKVLIMDGGTLDTIMSNTSTTVSDVATTFNQLLTTIAKDGTVTAIIYYLMPDNLPAITGVQALHPLLQQECEASAVPCHFLDLTPLWAGHPEYTNTVSGVDFPSEAGAAVIGDAIWSIMQTYCIAQ
jgi:hypothetical protein